MIDLGYDAIYSLYQEFFKNIGGNIVMAGFKYIAVALFLLNIFQDTLSRLGRRYGAMQEGSEMDLPFSSQRVVGSLIMILILLAYQPLLEQLDRLLLPLDKAFMDYDNLTNTVGGSEELNTATDKFSSWGAAILAMASKVVQFLTQPAFFLALLLKGIAVVIDHAIFVVFLVERFFFLGILKILGAFAITLSVFEKFRPMFYKWLKLYIALYLIILPFFLILGFGSFVYKKMNEYVSSDPSYWLIENYVTSIVLIVMIWIKLRLFKKSYELVYKIIE